MFGIGVSEALVILALALMTAFSGLDADPRPRP
jgi:hypothetical protein